MSIFINVSLYTAKNEEGNESGRKALEKAI